MNDYTFGNFLYELRTEKGLSQSELGEIMGVSNKTVSKWEMGVSKPRPAMLVVLASFFCVTVEELLAGERNAKAEQLEHQERDDAVLKLWTGEYRKKKRRGLGAVITALLLPVLLFVYVGVTVAINLDDTVVGPVVLMLSLFAEAIDIALIFVFYGSARRLKRMLYAAYPEQSEKIKSIISPKMERVPMRKWEQICIITGASITLVCYILRIIIRYHVEKTAIWIAVDMWALLLASLALILEGVVLLHYCFRCRRKK